MTQALDLPVEIIPCPTIRESDGLAMSSRNQYLSAEERQRALSIHRALKTAEEQCREGYKQTNRLITTATKIVLDRHLLIDYVATVDPVSFKNVLEVTSPTLLAVAARVGATRLIDNLMLRP
jgi:pantoate--beta-alanine ligase